MLIGRQMGKSTVASIRALNRACFTDNAEVLIVSDRPAASGAAVR